MNKTIPRIVMARCDLCDGNRCTTRCESPTPDDTERLLRASVEMAKLRKCRDALAELVALKTLKDFIEAGPPKCCSDSEYYVAYAEWTADRDDYDRRKPLAWAAARAAIQEAQTPD